MVLTPEQIKSRLRKLHISPDKWLGQHFLVDPAVYHLILATTRQFLSKKDTILEVGSGLGTLTDELVKLGNSVISIEKDPVLAQNLTLFLNQPKNLSIIQGDVLKELGINPVFQGFESWAVVANIPYAISSPLIRSLLYRENRPRAILVLVQKEMAERIVAKAGSSSRGVLTVETEIMARGTMIEVVPPSAFWPAPKVESALLLLTSRNKPLVPDHEIQEILKLVRSGFSGKRKQLANSLSGALQRDKAEITSVLTKTGISPERRAETLTIEEWRRLTVALRPGV
jgi:16S rRNA (adenine1518-N6/adenine1519-N6)-dimethyltransferase